MLILFDVKPFNVWEIEAVILDEVKPSFNKEVDNDGTHTSTNDEHVGLRDPVEKETPGDSADVEAQVEDFKNSKAFVGQEVVDLSLEVVHLSVERASNVQDEEYSEH